MCHRIGTRSDTGGTVAGRHSTPGVLRGPPRARPGCSKIDHLWDVSRHGVRVCCYRWKNATNNGNYDKSIRTAGQARGPTWHSHKSRRRRGSARAVTHHKVRQSQIGSIYAVKYATCPPRKQIGSSLSKCATCTRNATRWTPPWQRRVSYVPVQNSKPCASRIPITRRILYKSQARGTRCGLS